MLLTHRGSTKRNNAPHAWQLVDLDITKIMMAYWSYLVLF